MQALDAPLIALTQQCGGDLRQLMFAFFSFLNRRTDFYLVPNSDDLKDGKATMGFKEGDAEKLLLAAFRQFPLRRIPKGAAGAGPSSTPTSPSSSPSPQPSSSAPPTKKGDQEIETVTNDDKHSTKETKDDDAAAIKGSTVASTTHDQKSTTTASSESSSSSSPPTKRIGSGTEGNMKGVEYNEEGLQIPVGNGGSTPQYKWTQTLEETAVLIGIPDTLRAKDLDVKITSTRLSVKTKKPLSLDDGTGKDAPVSSSSSSLSSSPHTFAEGELFAKVRPGESTWTVEGGVMVVTLDKFQKKFWPNVLVGDEKIDTEQVDSRRHIGDYDEITQAQIRKTIFDQTQYHKGLPSSDELLKSKSNTTTKTTILDTASSDPIPELPPGVEYIDKKLLDESDNKNNKSKPK
jgi:N-terminal conserved domain of Nudc./CS domain